MKPQPNCWIVISWYFRTSAILAKLLFWKGHITPGSFVVFNATSTSVGSLVSLAQLDAESENSKMFSDFITIYGSKKVFMVKWIGFLSGNLQVVWGNLQVRMAGVSWDLPIRPLLWLRCDSCITWVRKSQQDALQKVFSYRLKRPELLLGLPSYPEYQKRGATFGGTVPSSQTKCKIWTLKFFWANRWKWNPINSSFPRFSNNSYDGTFFSMGNWVFCQSWGIGETMINYYDMILLMVRSKSGTTWGWYVFPLFIGF